MNQRLFTTKAIGITTKTFFIFIVMLTSMTGFSQSIKLGVRAGVNLSTWNVSGVTDLTTKSVLRPEAAILAEIGLTKSFSIQPEFSYAGSGTEFNYENLETTEFKTSYLQIPVLAKYRLPNGIAFLAGPQAAFLLKANAKNASGEKEDIKSILKKNDFYFVTGIEYNLPVGIAFGVRYNAGLTNIYTQGDEKIKNSSFGFSVSYKFSAGNWKGK